MVELYFTIALLLDKAVKFTFGIGSGGVTIGVLLLSSSLQDVIAKQSEVKIAREANRLVNLNFLICKYFLVMKVVTQKKDFWF